MKNNVLHLLRQQSMDPALIPPNRLRGISTGLAFKFLSEAILNPGTKVTVRDHAMHGKADSHLFYMIGDTIDKLGLVGFTFSPVNAKTLWIRFDLYKD